MEYDAELALEEDLKGVVDYLSRISWVVTFKISTTEEPTGLK
jgi:hypothetical protein